MGSSPSSTGRDAPSVARSSCAKRCGRLALRLAPDCTPAKLSCWTMTSEASAYTSPPEFSARLALERCSCPLPLLVVGSGIDFDDRGEHELQRVPGPWQLFAV